MENNNDYCSHPEQLPGAAPINTTNAAASSLITPDWFMTPPLGTDNTSCCYNHLPYGNSSLFQYGLQAAEEQPHYQQQQQEEEKPPTRLACEKADDGFFPFDLPPGYLFDPTHKELIDYYLKRKIRYGVLPDNSYMIPEVDLYQYSPDELIANHGHFLHREPHWFFFTMRNRKYANGSRPSRAAGNGFWKPTGADKSIIHDGRTIGYMKNLDYYYGTPKQNLRSDWKMVEYRLNKEDRRPSTATPPPSGEKPKLGDYVLCKIYGNTHKMNKYIMGGGVGRATPPSGDAAYFALDTASPSSSGASTGQSPVAPPPPPLSQGVEYWQTMTTAANNNANITMPLPPPTPPPAEYYSGIPLHQLPPPPLPAGHCPGMSLDDNIKLTNVDELFRIWDEL